MRGIGEKEEGGRDEKKTKGRRKKEMRVPYPDTRRHKEPAIHQQ